MTGSENDPANSSSGEDETSSESEPDNTSTPPPSSNKTQPPSNSSSSDESDSQSDSDTPQLPDPVMKPDRSTGKRAAAEADGGEVKRIKKKTVVAVAAPDADNCVEKKQQQLLFQRLWSEENEIELIKGMIDYVEAKGKDPLADVNDFHEFVKRSLHVDVNDRQVLTKARRLKKKFENNAARVESKGKVRSFSNPHEKKMYELSKNLWGNDNNVVMNAGSKKVKVKVNVTPKTTNKSGKGNVMNVNVNEIQQKVVPEPDPDRLGSMGLAGLMVTDEMIMSKGLELVSGAKRVEMEEKWRRLKVQELEHFLKKMDVLKEQAEVVLNAIAKSSGAK